MKKLLSRKQAAEVLKKSERTLIRWEQAGKITSFRDPVNKYFVMYDKKEIEKLAHDLKEWN